MPTDGHPLTRLEGFEHHPIQVAVACELAASGVAERANVALRIAELEPGEDDLEAPGLHRLVGADDVESELAAIEVGLGQHVLEHIAVLAGDRLVGIADADAGLERVVGHADLVRRIGRRGAHLRGHTEVVGHESLVAVAVRRAEVLVHHLTDPHPVTLW